MNIASIDRGEYISVDVSVQGKTVLIEDFCNLIKFNKSEVEELIQALQQAVKELPEEPKYVVVFPQEDPEKLWEFFYLMTSGKIDYDDSAKAVLNRGAMNLNEIKAFSEHYEHFAIPVAEFKENNQEEF